MENHLDIFGAADYENAFKNLLKAYGNALGKSIAPSERGKVGLKIYTNSGPGLAAPLFLVKAVIYELEFRGV